MVLKILKKVFNRGRTSAENLGEELVDMLLDMNSEEKILNLATEEFKNLDLALAYSYLFSYKLVIRINDIRMNSTLLEDVYYNFCISICKEKLNECELEVDQVQDKVESLLFDYQKNFATKRNVEIKKVIELLCTELDNEIDLNLQSALANFLLRNITIIQDFLVDKSLYLRAKY